MDFEVGFFIVLFLLVILIIVGACIYAGVYEGTRTEVASYSIDAEVIHVVYAEEAISRSATQPTYKVAVRGADFAETIEITAQQFAEIEQHDIVEVKITEYEFLGDKHQEKEYEIVGVIQKGG